MSFSIFKIIFQTILFLLLVSTSALAGSNKIVITPDGGGEDLIENSLVAITSAILRGTEYLELPVAMSADGKIVLFGDQTLNRLSDVAIQFPERSREDLNHYPMDFSLTELRQLRLKNVFEDDPLALSLGIATLNEALSLIRQLDNYYEKKTSIVIEIKYPWLYKKEGKDISGQTLKVLLEYGYTTEKDKLYIQCFDPEELQRIYNNLMPANQQGLPLIQLIGENDGQETRQLDLGKWQPYNYDWLFTNIGLRMVSSYAKMLALPGSKLAEFKTNPMLKQYISDAHNSGLQLLAYSTNSFEQDLPEYSDDFDSLLRFLYSQAAFDGMYTTSFAKALQYTKRPPPQNNTSDLPPFFSNLKLSRPNAEDVEDVDLRQ